MTLEITLRGAAVLLYLIVALYVIDQRAVTVHGALVGWFLAVLSAIVAFGLPWPDVVLLSCRFLLPLL